MRAALAALLLALVTTGWFMLSLLPALRELIDRTDVEPLQLTRGGGDVRHFATTFQHFVNDELPALVKRVGEKPGMPRDGAPTELRDGSPAWYVPPQAQRAALPMSHTFAADLAERVIISRAGLDVPAGTALLKELYVDGALHGGDDVFYRAALVTGAATLGAGSSVLRWIDAGGDLRVGERSVLYGRASASGAITLEHGVRFQRVAAPCIRFEGPHEGEDEGEGEGERAGDGEGQGADEDRDEADVYRALAEARESALAWDVKSVEERARQESARETISLTMLVPPEGALVAFGRWLIDGDYEVPAGATVDSDLIVSGVLRLGERVVVRGAVKSATLIGGAHVVYHGAIVAATRLALGAGSHVAGPIVVEGEAELGPDCRVGGAADETTISAVSVRAGAGVTVYGEVWARGWGEVV